jgi:hypothetical protein
MANEKYDSLSVDDIECFDRQKDGVEGMIIQWTGNMGYGEVTIRKNSSGKIIIDDENMSKEFCKALMNKLIDKYYE